MKKILLFVSLALLFGASVASAELKVAVVDLNRVLTSDPQVKNLQEQLRKQFEGRSKEITNDQKSLQAGIEKYNKEGSKLKGDLLKKEQQKLIADEKKFQDKREKFQRELMDAQNQAMQSVLKKVEDAVRKIAVDMKYSLVLTKVSTAYNDPQLEITDDVIKSLKNNGVAKK